MALFTFYPYRTDGAGLMFETHELAGPEEALRQARVVLEDHRSAAEVVVWQGEARVGSVSRTPA